MGIIRFNAAYQLLALGAVLVLQTLYVIICARILGPEDFGRFSFIWGLIQVFLVGGDLGLHNTAIRKIASRRADSRSLSGTFFVLKGWLALILFGILSVVAILLPEDSSTGWALVLFAAGMVFQLISMGFNVVFQAHGKLYLGATNQVLLTFLQLVLGTATLWSGGRLLGLGAAYALAAALSLLLNREVFTRKIHQVSLQIGSDWKDFAQSSLPVGIGSFFAALSSRLGVTLLALLAGPMQTGLFGASSRITLALGNIPIAIFSAVLPAMAVHQREREPVRVLFNKALWLMLILAVPLALLLAGFSSRLVLLLYGRQYEAASPLLVILAVALIPAFVGMCFSHVLLSQHGLIRWLPWVTGLTLVANLMGCLVMIPMLGAMGAAWAVLIAEVVALVGYALSVWRYLITGHSKVQNRLS